MLFEFVDEAADQRLLRSYDDKCDSLLAAKTQHGGVVGGVKLHIVADAPRARIAGRDEQAFEPRALGERIGDGVFAPARSDEKNIHARVR